MKDLMGRAIWDYYYQENSEDLQSETSISELDDLPVSYLFRDYQEMNALEKKALDLRSFNFLYHCRIYQSYSSATFLCTLFWLHQHCQYCCTCFGKYFLL